ncbi:MAG: GNAT family N-acetyltransferase [Thermomicrobiales bacterium]
MSPASTLTVRTVGALTRAELDQLSDILIATVDGGASIGFVPPLERSAARTYWEHVIEPGIVLIVAEQAGRLAGSVQLHYAMKANGRHRAEIAKLIVHPDFRRRGIGRLLMEHAETVAIADGRTLLVLDTRDGDPSNELYRAIGYAEAGRIPHYARSASGAFDATVFYYKMLSGS